MERSQVSQFGDEIRELIGSSTSESDRLEAAILEEFPKLEDRKNNGKWHRYEDVLSGDLSEIHYLRFSTEDWNARLYFVVINEKIWCLMLKKHKSNQNLRSSTRRTLRERLSDAKDLASEE